MNVWRESTSALLSVLVTAHLAACTSEVSTEDEVGLGLEYDRLIEEIMPLVDDAQMIEYLSQVGHMVADPQDSRHLQWQFHLVNVTEPNAVAIPGGFVYVTRGLAERMDSMSELAGIMAHEISHVVHRHAVERMIEADRAEKAVVVACVLTGECTDLGVLLGIDLGGELLFAKYSQDDEIEADLDAVDYVVRAGIHPRGISVMFEKLMAERTAAAAPVEPWFATHPTEEERVARTNRAIAKIDPAVLARLRIDEPEFHAFLAKTRALPPALSAEEILSSAD